MILKQLMLLCAPMNYTWGCLGVAEHCRALQSVIKNISPVVYDEDADLSIRLLPGPEKIEKESGFGNWVSRVSSQVLKYQSCAKPESFTVLPSFTLAIEDIGVQGPIFAPRRCLGRAQFDDAALPQLVLQ